MRKKAILLLDDKLKIYQVDKNIIPFSFGNAIFINQQLHEGKELQEIIRHEFVHVKQKHTIDIIWGEVLCILNWYNPFAWLFRKAIRQNLEFIADNKVVQHGFDKKQYQYLLLKVIGNNHFSIAQKFNFSSLKKRIAMMNKMQSARLHLIKFLFILPLVAVLLLAFRQNAPKQIQSLYGKSYNDTLPPPVKTELPDNVKVINIGDDNIAIVKLRNGKIEKYNLDNNEEKAAFEEKYGEVPVPPLPPPPPPPMPPAVIKLPQGVTTIDVNENITTVILKNGIKEKYDLENEKEKAVFEKKYGKLLLPPPPPAVPVKEISMIDILPDTTKKPLVVVDGKQIGKVEEIDKVVKADEIKSVNVIKGEDAVKKYGDKGKDGVIEITKKSPLADFNGLILIDGEELEKGKKLDDVVKNPAEIESMHVWKGEKAIEKFGQKGINGVIEIKTKKQQ